MHQLLYYSIAAEGLESQEIFRIVETSAKNNPSRNVTGFLVFARDRFIQFIEGPAEELDALLEVLSADPRHREVTVLARSESAKRCCPAWRMRRVAADEPSISELLSDLRLASVSEEILAHIRRFFDRQDIAA